MAKPIFIIAFPYRLSEEGYLRMREALQGYKELHKDYHTLIFDGSDNGFQFHVLNGQYTDIMDLEQYIKEIRNEQKADDGNQEGA